MPRLAVVQRPPVFLNRAATLERAAAAIDEAAAGGAQLIVFPEAFVPGYPAWIWRLKPGDDHRLIEQLHLQLLDNAVSLDEQGGDLASLCEAARRRSVTVVCGIDERETQASRGTLYNTVVVIGPDGRLLNRHRKVMPTNPERMVWGFGDASGLRAVEAPPFGRIGALICWENYMPLARCALYGQGIDLYIAPTYDEGARWLATMQHITREAGCWVVGSGCAFRGADIAEAVPALAASYPDSDKWVNAGDSVVVSPQGKVVAGPMHESTGILYADIDIERVGAARRTLDSVGHYSRPDLFELHVNTAPQRGVRYDR